MVLTPNLTPPSFHSSSTHQPLLSRSTPTTPVRHTSHWGDLHPYTLPLPHQAIFLHRLPTPPYSSSLNRSSSLSTHSICVDHSSAPPSLIRPVHSDSLADTVIWASFPGRPGPLRRRSGSDSLHDDFNNTKGFDWLTQHLRLSALYTLQTAMDFQASPVSASSASMALSTIAEHLHYTPTPKIHLSQYHKYHLTSSGRPSRFFPRLLDELKHEAPPGMFVSGGPNLNAKRDAINVLTAMDERSLPGKTFLLRF